MAEQAQTGLNYIINNLELQAKQDRADYIAKEEARINKLYAEQKKQIELESEKQLQQSKDNFEKKLQQLNHRFDLELVQYESKQKNYYTDKLFQEVLAQFEKWDDAKFILFYTNVAGQIDFTGEIQVLLGENSKTNLKQDDVDKWSEAKKQFVLSEDVVKNCSGVVFAQDGIEYDLTFEAIVAELRMDKQTEVVQQLFPQRGE